MNAPRGSLVYKAPACGWSDAVWAVSTLFVFFFLTLVYVLLVPWALWAVFVQGSWIMAAAVTALALTAVWPARYWSGFTHSQMLESWRRWHWLRVWRDEARFGQSSNVLLAMVPHGMFPLGLPMLSSIQDEIFPEFRRSAPAMQGARPQDGGIKTVVANAILYIPLLALMLKWLNCTYATRTHLEECLATGNAIVIPDGIAGMYHTDCAEERVYLSTRHGFIRAALEQGSLLVPCFWFGHTQLWSIWPKHDSWLAALSRRLRFSLIWFWGFRWMPPLPQRVPLTLVVGRGIACPKTDRPTREQVEAVHKEFTQALSALYYQYRPVVAGWDPKKPLIIV